jgi:hypothetical protein
MSQADADALVASPQAKSVFASAIAKTFGLHADNVTISALYVNGALVNERRRLTDAGGATVKADWSATAVEGVVDAAAMDTNALKTNIETDAMALANAAVTVTATPALTIDATPMPITVPTPVPTPAPVSLALSSTRLGLASFVTNIVFIINLL